MTARFLSTLAIVSVAFVGMGSSAAHADDAETFADSAKLVTISNDRNSSVAQIDLAMSAKSDVIGVIYTDGQGAQKSLSLAEIGSAEGGVLEAQQGVKALILLGRIQGDQGQLTFRYVSNGLTKTYKDCATTVRRSASGWTLANANGVPVTAAKLVTWSLGIKTIEGICP